ncbi:MAG: prepilin peptidase [Candidatus Peribacteraceae bacterium]|nr:prepilin peptidase [Candidatus Peribacteraceae bacterium]
MQTVLFVTCALLLLSIAIVDARIGMIPDFLNVPFFLFALLYGCFFGSSVVLPVLIGGGFFAIQWLLSQGKWVGSGDIILAAGIGAFVGDVLLLVIALGVAYALGSVAAVVLLVRKQKTIEQRMVFGPFLAAGALVSFVGGERILEYF